MLKTLLVTTAPSRWCSVITAANRDAVSATHCEECSEPLPEARRKAYPGCTMCVDCQGEMELRNKQRGM
ncbi:hypothetical protein NU34_004085 [Salmonella enterica subsp. enterica]|nr:hypothetical protein [Salmonella enterica subsp. enterica]EDT2976830.1 hypothetical protein [Salmonella enterica subsp. enterica]